MPGMLSKIFGLPSYAPRLRCPALALHAAVILCLGILVALEFHYLPAHSPVQALEEMAIITMREASHSIREFRLKEKIAIDPVLDPNATGLIGAEYSDLTTTEGLLIAKRTSTNPAFAGVIVRLLYEAGVREGDRIAVSLSGSFPALNIALLSACKAMGLEPVIISSVGASTYGANIPRLTWLDMEWHLRETEVFPYRSMAASLGGIVEANGGIDGKGLILGREAIARSDTPFLDEGDYRSVERDLLRRRQILESKGPVKAFVNVGGSLTSLGWLPEAAYLDVGLLKEIPSTRVAQRGLIFRYFEDGLPVIHLLNVARLAERYALPIDPGLTH